MATRKSIRYCVSCGLHTTATCDLCDAPVHLPLLEFWSKSMCLANHLKRDHVGVNFTRTAPRS